MNLSEHEKAILAIEALSQQIGDRGVELEDQMLVNIASNLQLFMISAIAGDLPSFLNHINDFREKKIQESLDEIENLRIELTTGRKVTATEKIARMKLSTNN
jgi:hypothetical protein